MLPRLHLYFPGRKTYKRKNSQYHFKPANCEPEKILPNLVEVTVLNKKKYLVSQNGHFWCLNFHHGCPILKLFKKGNLTKLS